MNKQNRCQLRHSIVNSFVIKSYEKAKKVLAIDSQFVIFALARVPNYLLPLCQLKRIRHFKFLPGLAFGLGTLAGPYIRFRRAVLCLVPSITSLLNSARYA